MGSLDGAALEITFEHGQMSGWQLERISYITLARYNFGSLREKENKMGERGLSPVMSGC